MKRFIIFSLIWLVLANISFGQSKIVFGVKPGSTINSAYLGLKMNNLVPFFGIDVLGISASGKYSDENEDQYDDYYGNTRVFRNIETEEFSGSALLIIPHFGAKLFIGAKDVRPYILGNIFFSIPSVSADAESKDESWEYENGQLVDHDIEIDSDKLEDRTKDMIKDVLSFWGVTLGFGAEYFFSDHFSLGGEYGIRLLFNKIEYSDEDHSSDGANSSYTEKWEGETSANLKISYAAVTLNYYF